ncbi:unnamed protein product [Boreogadus saida]
MDMKTSSLSLILLNTHTHVYVGTGRTSNKPEGTGHWDTGRGRGSTEPPQFDCWTQLSPYVCVSLSFSPPPPPPLSLSHAPFSDLQPGLCMTPDQRSGLVVPVLLDEAPPPRPPSGTGVPMTTHLTARRLQGEGHVVERRYVPPDLASSVRSVSTLNKEELRVLKQIIKKKD